MVEAHHILLNLEYRAMPPVFPAIRHIDDVLPALQGHKEFVVSQRNGYVAIDYTYQLEGSFLPADPTDPADVAAARLRRECRGIKFDPASGAIIARPYAKFFNLGENSEVQPDRIDWTRSHHVLDKLDGSMIAPALVDGGMRWMTRLSDAKVAASAHAFAMAHPSLPDMAHALIDDGWTPIFEWCGPSQRIILDYPDDTLILTAVRHRVEGHYLAFAELTDLAATWQVPVVADLACGLVGDTLVQHIRGLHGLEGCVIRFGDGTMLKLKAEAYLARHQALADLASEKRVLRLVLENQEDDVLPLLAPEPRAELASFAARIRTALQESVRQVAEAVAAGQAEVGLDRKRFATEVVPRLPKVWHFPAFSVASGRDAHEAMRQLVLKNLGSDADLAFVRPLIGGHRWRLSGKE